MNKEGLEKMSNEELDEAVIEAKCGEASDINNSGREEQMKYLGKPNTDGDSSQKRANPPTGQSSYFGRSPTSDKGDARHE